MISQIAYTNSNCRDLWEMFIQENEKHTTLNLNIISDLLATDDNLLMPTDYTYSNDDPYYLVWVEALRHFGDDYFIYLQEDFILYDGVNEDKIKEYVTFLKENPEYSFVRLLKATSFKNKRLTDTLYEVGSSNKNVFAMQPTIWRTEDYIKLMLTVKEPKWLEPKTYRQNIMRMGMKGAYHYSGEMLAGKHHYNSSVYPYIATALVKGKWNISEYGLELRDLFIKYNIDPNKRGTC